MNTPTDEVLFAITGWKGRHAGDHGSHFAQMGYQYDSIDPANGDSIKPNKVAIQHRCNLETFLHGNKTPLGIIIASPDSCHMSDLEKSVEAWIRHILDEKPMALNAKDLWRLIELKQEAQRKWIRMTTCLPRITDARYGQLVNMIPGLIAEFWKVTSISHSFTSRNIPKPGSSAGRDHFSHEITMLLKILWCSSNTSIHIDKCMNNDEPNFYFCEWKIGEVTFDVGGEKSGEKNEERVNIDFQNGAELHFSTLTWKIQILGGNKPITIPLKEGGPEARLMEITQNFVQVALGEVKDFYLPDSLFLASAELPATLFPNQTAAS